MGLGGGVCLPFWSRYGCWYFLDVPVSFACYEVMTGAGDTFLYHHGFAVWDQKRMHTTAWAHVSLVQHC